MSSRWQFKSVSLAIVLVLGLSISTPSQSAENPLFGFTHLLPSPYTLPAGRVILGTSFGVGVTDFFQVGTDLLRDFYKIFNANAKLQILDFEEFALAATLGFEHFNYNNIDSSNPDLSITSWQPGLVASYALHKQLAVFAGGNVSLTSIDPKTSGIQTSGYVRGFSAESDISWAYNPKKKSMGNILSGGLTYDFTYSLVGFGVSHHWGGFHIGIHYVPGASKNKLLPILSGGAVVDL